MHKKNIFNWSKKWFCSVSTIIFVGIFAINLSWSSGFQLWNENGIIDAGGAAAAENAAAEFFNPAGMVRIKHPELSMGAGVMPFNTQFQGSIATLPVTNGMMGNANLLIPNLHFVFPFYEHWHAGLGITMPFGLISNYGNAQGSPGALAAQPLATLTQIMTANINPSLAYAFNEHFSLGVGLNALYVNSEFDTVPMVTIDSLLQPVNFNNSLSGWGWGYNVGMLLQLSEQLRVGLSYRSQTTINAEGRSWLHQPGFATPWLYTNNLHASMNFPASTLLSIFQQINSNWIWDATAAYTQWSVLQSITLQNSVLGVFPPGLSTLPLPFNYHNSWFFIVGSSYRIHPTAWLKAALGYDQTPSTAGYRDIRFLSADAVLFTIATHWQPSAALGLDLGWTHLFMQDTNIDTSQIPASALVPLQMGTLQSSADVLGMQVSWSFADSR